MNITKRIFNGICAGITFGIVISLSFSEWYGINYVPSAPQFMDKFSSFNGAFTVSLILWELMGVMWSLSGLVFKIKTWSLLKRTVVNLLISYSSFTVLAILCGWFPLNIWLVYYTLIFFLIYVTLWLINFVMTKKSIRQINRKLRSK